MCIGGGGDGGRGQIEEANREAEEEEIKRQARVNEAQKAIREIFGDPGNQVRYQGIGDNIFNTRRAELEDQRAEANLAAKFALARSGGLGGSQQASAIDDLNRRENSAIITSANQAQSARDQALSADANLQDTLLRRAAAGEDQSALIDDATRMQRINAADANNRFRDQQLGDIFSGAESLFRAGRSSFDRQTGENRFKQLLGEDDDLGPFFNPGNESGKGNINSIS